MALVLTNLYLGSSQKKFLEKRAKENKTNLSVETRRAIDAYEAGMNVDDLLLIDAATKQAAVEIEAMNETLDNSLKRAEVFFAEIARLKGKA